MSLYVDTSALAALFFPEAASEAVARAVRGQSIRFTALHSVELTNALALKVFRKEGTAAALEASLRHVQDDLAAGRLVPVEADWNEVARESARLSRLHTPRLGTRSLDVLHVALALQLRSTRFLTLDPRQARLARTAGLTVPPIH
jgi:predicted nucleic acid-binding protein